MSIAILWPSTPSNDVEESNYANIFCRRTTLNFLSKDYDIVWSDYGEAPSLHDILSIDGTSHILFVTEPKLIVTSQCLNALLAESDNHSCASIPVYNFTENQAQQCTLPYSYDTVTTFLELAAETSKRDTGCDKVGSTYDSGCILIPVKLFSQSDSSLSVTEYSRTLAGNIHITSNALAHRFADYANIPRPELIDLVPANISTALDVGCGKGQYGRLLKLARPEIHLTGIEKSKTLADTASPYYDKLIVGDLEHLTIDIKADLINCGDILEHLTNPWSALEKLGTLLNPGGYLIASVPNASHWSIISELSQGHFDYLPAGLLCVGHLRWFTEDSFKDILTQSGLVIDKIVRHKPAPSPKGEKLIKLLMQMPDHNEEALRTHTLYFRVIKPE